MNQWILIAFFGIIGTLIRALSVKLTGDFAPWTTLIVNIIGSLGIGVAQASHLSTEWKSYMSLGLLGALTTFSGYTVYLVNWFEGNELELAAIYFLATNFLCVGACYVGYKAIL